MKVQFRRAPVRAQSTSAGAPQLPRMPVMPLEKTLATLSNVLQPMLTTEEMNDIDKVQFGNDLEAAADHDKIYFYYIQVAFKNKPIFRLA